MLFKGNISKEPEWKIGIMINQMEDINSREIALEHRQVRMVPS